MGQHTTSRSRSDHECVQLIQNLERLKESVQALYASYCGQHSASEELDADIRRGYARQKDYLEKSVEGLKRKLATDSELHAQDNMRVMQENMALIKEINELRRESKFLKQTQHEKDVVSSGSSHARGAGTGVAGDIDEETLRLIEEQRAEVGELKAQITELEGHMHLKRPISLEKLPPMAT